MNILLMKIHDFSIDRDHDDIYQAKNDFSYHSDYLMDDEEALYNA